MSQATPQDGLELSTVLNELSSIVQVVQEQDLGGGAPYEGVQQGLESLSLHILTYIRFLENHGYVEYNRVADVLRVSPKGEAACTNAELWRGEAGIAFEEHVGGGEDHTALELELDDIVDSINIGGFDDGDSATSNFSPGITAPDEDPTGPNIQTPAPEFLEEEALEPIQPSEPLPEGTKPIQNTPSLAATDMNQQDSSYQRRFSSGTHAAAPQKAATDGVELFAREEEIGSGGMGTVFLANQVRLNRRVAVKEIKEIFDVFAGVQRSDIVARFTQIVQTQSALVHPNIIDIIDIDTDARFPFVVMQYAPNGNLRRLIEMEGRPSLQVALKYLLQILHALSAAHDANVTHGGIKPENVVLDSAGNAMLTDFGISGVVELDNSRANQVYVGVGTVAYMSPEQFRDPNASSVKSDIYSLGIMLYEMLTGKVPGRRSPMPSSFYPDIPRKLDDVFDRMSMDDASDRYDSIDAILADIYGDKDIMKILDKRGGFVFLRDPMSHGATGLKVDLPEQSDGEIEAYEGGASLSEDSSSAGEEDSDAEDLADDDSDAEEEASEESSEEGDVLDKLDKYGKLFDEDGDDEDSDDDDSDDEGDDD